MISIIKQISLEPKYFDTAIKHHLLNQLVEKYLGSCTQECGSITEVLGPIDILSNKISTASSVVFFSVKFNIKAIKPKIGKKYIGQIIDVYEDGLWLKPNDNIRVFIPANSIKDHYFNEPLQNFRNEDGNKKNDIVVGSTICTEVTFIRYEEQRFECLGSYVKDIKELSDSSSESSDDESESSDDESESSDDESESSDDESESSDDESESSDDESENFDDESESESELSDDESESSDDESTYSNVEEYVDSDSE